MSPSYLVLATALLVAQQDGDFEIVEVPESSGNHTVMSSPAISSGSQGSCQSCGDCDGGGCGGGCCSGGGGGLFSRFGGGLFQGRLKGLFSRGQCCQEQSCGDCQGCCGDSGPISTTPAYPATPASPTLPPVKTQVGYPPSFISQPQMVEPPLAQPTRAPTSAVPLPGAPPLPEIFAPSMSSSEGSNPQTWHDAGYHQIVGRLYRGTAGDGSWVLRYGEPGSDPYNGQVILSTAARLESLHDGEVIAVHGEILNADSAVNTLGAPIYRATSVELIPSAK